LWDPYLASLAATDVFSLQTSATEGGSVVVRGTRSTPGGVDQLVVSQTGPVGTEDRAHVSPRLPDEVERTRK